MTRGSLRPPDAATLLAQRQEVLEGNRQFGDICRDMLTRDRFDLFLACVRRGASRLALSVGLVADRPRGCGPADTRAVLEGSLDDCYTSADEALGRVLDAAPPDARVIVFALHGMGPNDGWYEFLPRILEQIHRAAAAPRRRSVASCSASSRRCPGHWCAR